MHTHACGDPSPCSAYPQATRASIINPLAHNCQSFPHSLATSQWPRDSEGARWLSPEGRRPPAGVNPPTLCCMTRPPVPVLLQEGLAHVLGGARHGLPSQPALQGVLDLAHRGPHQVQPSGPSGSRRPQPLACAHTTKSGGRQAGVQCGTTQQSVCLSIWPCSGCGCLKQLHAGAFCAGKQDW